MIWFVGLALAGTKVQIGLLTVNGQTIDSLACDWSDPKGAVLAGPAIVNALATAKGELDRCAPQGSAAKLRWSGTSAKPELLGSEDPTIGACIAAASAPIVGVTKGACTAIVHVGDPKRAGAIAAPLHDPVGK